MVQEIWKAELVDGSVKIALGENRTYTTNNTNYPLKRTISGNSTWIPVAPKTFLQEGKTYTRRASGGIFRCFQVTSDPVWNKKLARQVGARNQEGVGLAVPTLEGVLPAFVGDWITVDQDGIVDIYTEENFSKEYKYVLEPAF